MNKYQSLVCYKKKAYAEYKQAINAIERKFVNEEVESIGIYICPNCNCWHLTHKIPKET